MKKKIENLFDFIEESPTAFHTVGAIQKRLEKAGFIELEEHSVWSLVLGGRYFVKRNDSSLISFVLPKKQIHGFHIVASHTDSPSFKVKTSPEIRLEDSYVKLNVEKYGGMILSTWLDRPLSLAGRVFYEEENHVIKNKLVNIDRDFLVIPNLAIHMNREINQGYTYNPQTDMLPIFSENKEKKLRRILSEELGIKEGSILSEELFLYVRQKGCVVGADGEWIMAPRLDDLQCVYAAVEAMALAEPKEFAAMSAFFDNEEVGSSTKQGADSDFLECTLKRIGEAFSISDSELGRLLSQSFLISADNAHAFHPNHPEKADITNRTKLNGGIVIKHHGGQKYTTDGYSAAYLVQLCREAGVTWQDYCNRSDIPGGSTLGNISTAHVSVPSADIGFAQLAMHSAVETAGREDVWQGISLFHAFWSK